LSSTGFGGEVVVRRSGVLAGVEVLVFHGWDESDLAVQSSVVVPVDVLRDGDLEIVDTSPGALVPHQFGFEQRVECLGHGVVVGITDGPDRGHGLRLGEALGIANGPVLNAAITVMDKASARSVCKDKETCQPTMRREKTSRTNAA
jgi:hypothetical protein